MLDNIKYTIINNNELMEDFINFFKNNNFKYVGIDFEYHKNKIKLWQLCFDNNVFIIYEKIIKNKYEDFIIKNILLSKIIKIFHGGESLDFPYLFNLLKEPKLIYKFLKHTFDTRFLCEYYKLLFTNNKICNIYDSMLYFNAIDNNLYNELQKINKNMGHIWKINWDTIENNKNLIIYTIYDVLYLKRLLIKIFNKYKEKNLSEDFYELKKINSYILIKRNNINYDIKLNIKNLDKYKTIDYYKNIL